jgi:DNA-binding transcriptional LysR family regulator
MDLKRLERFVIVARTLNFRRAAKELGITQPPLTRSILELEKSLGTRLFTRTTKAIALTAAGQVLLAEAPRLIAQANLIAAMTVRAGRESPRIQIGYVTPALYRVIPAILRSFSARWSGLNPVFLEMSTAEQLSRLRDGRLDIGFVILGAAALQDLNFRLVERSRLVLAVPADLPLARNRRLHLGALRDLPFILQSPEVNPATYQETIDACAIAGFTPRVVQRVNQSFAILKFVAGGMGVGFVPEIAAELKIEGVRLLRVVDDFFDVGVSLGIAWAGTDLRPEMQDLVRLAEIAGRRSRRTSPREKQAL